MNATTERRRAEDAAHDARLQVWHRHFAWLPVDVDGRLVWLRPVERRATITEGYGHRWVDFQHREVRP